MTKETERLYAALSRKETEVGALRAEIRRLTSKLQRLGREQEKAERKWVTFIAKALVEAKAVTRTEAIRLLQRKP